MPARIDKLYRATVMYLWYSYHFSKIEPEIRERLERFCGTDMSQVPMNLIPYEKQTKIAERMMFLQKYIEDNWSEVEEIMKKFDDMTEQEFVDFYKGYRKEQNEWNKHNDGDDSKETSDVHTNADKSGD